MMSAHRAGSLTPGSDGVGFGEIKQPRQIAHGANNLHDPARAQQVDAEKQTIVVLRWIVLDRTDADAEGLWPLLDGVEQARASRFRFATDRRAYVAAHALLRLMLSQAGGVPPRDWRFLTMPAGKPYIDPELRQPDLHFSLSHSRGIVACAVGRALQIGVDVEDRHQQVPVLDMARLTFAPAEIAYLEQLPPDGQASMFYRLWTLKEAYGKATGRGIAAPMDGFAFLPDPGGMTLSPHGFGSPEGWLFREFDPGANHWLALAVQPRTASATQLDAAALSMSAVLAQASSPAWPDATQENSPPRKAATCTNGLRGGL